MIMKPKSLVIIASILFIAEFGNAQKIIPLYNNFPAGSESRNWKGKEYFTNIWNEKVAFNVIHPTLSVFLPDSASSDKTAVIICPGGGFRILAIDVEGDQVARWLNKRGIACFVLRYRLVQMSTDDPVKVLTAGIEQTKFNKENDSLIPLAVADAAAALAYVRAHAMGFGIDPKKIGIIGFSAGGILAGSMAFSHDAANRPDFTACIYTPVPPLYQNSNVPEDAPPLFLSAASDDEFHLIPGMLAFYSKWQAAGKSAEIHLYEKGGHGFGMNIQRLTTDNWIDRFGEWLKQQHF